LLKADLSRHSAEHERGLPTRERFLLRQAFGGNYFETMLCGPMENETTTSWSNQALTAASSVV
jgi:hypothetical protein